jgi:hypothetical protein
MPVRMFGDDVPVLRVAADAHEAISRSPPLLTQRVTFVDGEPIIEELVSVSAEVEMPGIWRMISCWEPVQSREHRCPPHYCDNQGVCHYCGVVMNADWALNQ